MEVQIKYRLMAKYDRNLAQLHHIAFVELAGSYTGPQLIRILLSRGEKPISDGGWVPAHRKSMLGMVRRAQAIANKVVQENSPSCRQQPR